MTTATAGTTPCKKRIYIRPSNVAALYICSVRISVYWKTCSDLTCTDSVQFQKKIPLRFAFSKIRRTCSFHVAFLQRTAKKMYQDSKRTCTAIVLLIKPFVWCLSRCRRRRGLLKLLIVLDTLFTSLDSKISGFTRPHIIGFVADIFFPLWRVDLFFSGFAVEFAGYVWTVAVSGKKSCGFQNIRTRVDGA